MRWIAGFLLLLNIAVFAWFWRMPVSSRPIDVIADAKLQDVPTLVFLSELTRPVPVVLSPLAVPSLTDIPVEAARTCVSVGPFSERSDAALFIADYPILQPKLDIQLELVRTEYRVYIPPFDSLELATQVFQELSARIQQAGLTIETFLITRGDLQNGIALGLFAEQTNASNVERLMVQLGYTVTIAEEARTREVFHVTMSTSLEAPNLLVIWPQIMAQRSYLQRTEKLC